MRRAGSQALVGVLVVAGIAGCGRKPAGDSTLTFESLPDSAALVSGAPLLESFEAERMANGALRVHGVMNVPDGTRIQVAIKRPGERTSVSMAQMEVSHRRFDSPPLIGERGPLPRARYRFEVLAHFGEGAQPASVLRATADGKALRGPGITRTRQGDAAFFLARELAP